MQTDLDGFIRESVTAMRKETARLCSEVLDTIDGSTVTVHQRTLDRLSGFIERFRSLNFAGDAQLEATLEKFRKDLLTRSADDYRNDRTALTGLTDGLQRLRESAVRLAATAVIRVDRVCAMAPLPGEPCCYTKIQLSPDTPLR